MKKNLPIEQYLPVSVAMLNFERFWQTELGINLLQKELNELNAILPALAGYNCLQLSACQTFSIEEPANIGQTLKMGFALGNKEKTGDFLADFEQFPIANDCVDIVILHHVLEFAKDPTQILREADRVLTAGGQLIILGFNLWSLWPLYQHLILYRKEKEQLLRASAQSKKQLFAKSLRCGRLEDWLSVLNYDVLQEKRQFPFFPINSERWLRRVGLINRFGYRIKISNSLVYLIHARKRTYAGTRKKIKIRRAIKPKKAPSFSNRSTYNRLP